jgi:hypothetical protein
MKTLFRIAACILQCFIPLLSISSQAQTNCPPYAQSVSDGVTQTGMSAGANVNLEIITGADGAFSRHR